MHQANLYTGSTISCASHLLVGTPFEAMMVQNGVDGTAVEGAANLPYEVPNLQVAWNMAPGGVPTLWWRSVGSSHTAFVVEGFIDELAKAAGKDPYEYRRMLMINIPVIKRVLEIVAEKAGWKTPVAPAGEEVLPFMNHLEVWWPMLRKFQLQKTRHSKCIRWFVQ